jgi:acetaldehyde dehydrogenase (acetylating)
MKLKVGIIGTGNIGTDLLIKAIATGWMDVVVFCGRRDASDGIKKAELLGIKTSTLGIQYFIDNPKCCDVVFDCTNAIDAKQHAGIFKEQGIRVIDLTPSKVGPMCIPVLNGDIIIKEHNVNMVTCGGQSSVPILNLISQCTTGLEYIEIVSQIASKSAGMATRINVDHYIHTTESAIKKFTGCNDCKVILNLNPAVPELDMQTTMFAKAADIDFNRLQQDLNNRINLIKQYVPLYEMVMMPTLNEEGILILSIKVRGRGDYLPKYAGNLDIINCAAIEVANRLQRTL